MKMGGELGARQRPPTGSEVYMILRKEERLMAKWKYSEAEMIGALKASLLARNPP